MCAAKLKTCTNNLGGSSSSTIALGDIDINKPINIKNVNLTKLRESINDKENQNFNTCGENHKNIHPGHVVEKISAEFKKFLGTVNRFSHKQRSCQEESVEVNNANHQYTYDEKGYIVCSKGLVINGRYQLVEALGKGTFSRVFGANDLITKNKKAVKVIRNLEKYQIAAKIESKVLFCIRDNDPESNYPVIHIIDYSYYNSHPIFIFPLYGRSLYRFLADNYFQPFPDCHVKHIIRQIIQAVAYVHSLGIIITDLKSENIVICNDICQKITTSEGISSEVLVDSSIKLIDFGSAVFANNCCPKYLIQTRHCRAPEVVLNQSWNYSADTWSIGCLIVEIISGKILFTTHDDIDHLNQISRCIGPIPQTMIDKTDKNTRNALFKKDGSINLDKAEFSQLQCQSLQSYFKLHSNHLNHSIYSNNTTLENNIFSCKKCSLHDLTKKMLRWHPSFRETPRNALNHAYFAN